MSVAVQIAAQRDLQDILAYLEENAGAATALKFARAFDLCLSRIARFPQSGAPRPKLGAKTRAAIVRPYILYYDCETATDDCVVLRILHARRNVTERLLVRPKS